MIIEVKQNVKIFNDGSSKTSVSIPLFCIAFSEDRDLSHFEIHSEIEKRLKEVSWFGIEIGDITKTESGYLYDLKGFDLREYVAMIVYCRRVGMKMTQKELAVACGYKSANSIARIENGNDSPSLKTLIRILDILGVSFNVFVK